MADDVEEEELDEPDLESDEEFPDDAEGDFLEDDDALADDDLVADEGVEVEEADDEVEGEAKAAPARRAADADEDEEDDEEEGDDVEASLDVILKERLVVEDVEEEDDDEDDPAAAHHDDGDSNRKVIPRRPDEFVCQSCFLVKHPSQLADKERQLCLDCVRAPWPRTRRLWTSLQTSSSMRRSGLPCNWARRFLVWLRMVGPDWLVR